MKYTELYFTDLLKRNECSKQTYADGCENGAVGGENGGGDHKNECIK
jgi:hypothetical protein